MGPLKMVQSLEQLSDDDVVISGIGGIFPSCRNIDELRESLLKKEDLCMSVANDKNWKRDNLQVTDKIGKIKDPEKFDNQFFGISAAQTRYMDPITRKMLERSYEAIIDSGYTPTGFKKFTVSVYMGSNTSFSEATFLTAGAVESGFTVMGHNRSMLANRVSYWLNSKGPSYAFYATEPAGLQGITMAYRDIKAGYCDAAIVGTIFLLSQPEQLLNYKRMGLLGYDGACKAFDATADGFSRGEACVVICIQRAKDAKRIYASVVHSDYKCYGIQENLIYPERDLFTDFLANFYKTCKVDPDDIVYLEAEGTSTKYHDSLELNTVDKVLCSNRKSPLLVGTVKSNLGHTEACSSFVSLAKLIIAIETGFIPANLHYKTPSPLIPALTEGRIKVVTETTELNGGLIAINSIGIGAEFAHTLLRPYIKKKLSHTAPDNIPQLICVSARHEDGIKNVLQKITQMPYDAELVKLIHDIHTANIANHNYRGYTILLPPNKEKICDAFDHFNAAKKPVWFVFSGMGSQWIGMGRDLMKHPILASSLQKCHELLLPKGVDLINILTGDDPHIFDNILHSFVGIAAIQIALVDFLRALKIEPDGIIGHSVGELGCAYADGCFTLEQMILAAYYRGLASIETELLHGSMAAIGRGYNDMKDNVPEGIDIACHNSGDSCTISGPTEIVLSYVETLVTEGVFAKAVNVSNIAYHSRYIQPAGPKLLEYLKKVIPEPRARSSKWVSSSVPETQWDSSLAKYSSAEYHTNNLTSCVLFEEASKYIPHNAITIEIAPHGLLQAILRRSLDKDCINVPLTQRDSKDGLEFLLTAVGKLYIAGIEPHLYNIYPPVEYPVSTGTPSLTLLFTWDHEKTWHIPTEARIESDISLGSFKMPVDLRSDDQILRGQKVKGQIIYPASAFLISLWKWFFNIQRQDPLKHAVVFENIKFYDFLMLSENSSITLQISIAAGCKRFEICHDKKPIVTGLISMVDESKTDQLLPDEDDDDDDDDANINKDDSYELSGKEIYKELEQKGFQYSNFYRGIHHAKVGKESCVARVQWFGDWFLFMDSIIQFGIWHRTEGRDIVELPTYIQRVIIDPVRHENNSKEYTAVYENNTNIIRCGGIEVTGIETSEVSLTSKQQVNLETVRFLPHDNPCLQSKEEFLEVAIQLLLENIPLSLKNKAVTFVELTNDLTLQPLLYEVKYILSHKEEIKADFKSVPVDNARSLNEEKNILFVLANEGLIEEAVEVIKNSSGFLLVRLPAEQSVPLNLGLVTVTEQQFDDEKYILLKRKIPVDRKETVFIQLKNETTFWSKKLKDATSGAKSDKKTYIVCEETSYDKAQEFVSEALQQHKANNVRYIFILDNHIPWCNRIDPHCYQHLSQDLLVNIFHNGSWGSFRHLTLPPKKKLPLKNLMCSVSATNFDIRFVGFNMNDWCVNNTNKEDILNVKNLGPLDLSGWSSDGKKIMGLSYINAKKNTVEVDPYFIWTIPNHWSLQDAATVPLAYALAYYTLTVKHKMKEPGKTILIHGGHTMIGLAFIAVALQFKCIVYTTVYSNDDMQQVLKRFPQISNKNIFKINKLFNYKLMSQVNGAGVDIIISCLREPFFKNTLKCIKLQTDIFHFCQEDISQNMELGMEFFLQCVSFSTVLPEHLFGINSEQKEQLHDMIEDGLVSGTVQPFQRNIFTMEDEYKILRSVNHERKVVVDICNRQRISSSVFQDSTPVSYFSKDNVCLVIGPKPEDCLDVSKWLVTKNVQNIIMYSETPASSDYEKRQLHMLQSSYTKCVKFSSVDRTHSTQDLTASLIKECTDTAPLESIILVSEDDQVFLNHLDSETHDIQSLKNFICLATDCPRSIINSKRKQGVSVLDVKWSGQQTLQQVLPALDNILPDPPLSTVYVTLRNLGNKEAITSSKSDKLNFLLPSTLKGLEYLGHDVELQKTCPYVELPSQSPGLRCVKEVLPIFIIPGLKESSKKVVELLARNIMYPVILLRIPPGKTIEEMAKTLVKHMRSVQSEGPYNIIGLSWSGVLALEVAQQLQNVNEKTQVYLIDATPQIIHGILQHLGEGSQLQVNLVMYLLGLTSKKIQDELLNMKNWDEQLERVLSEKNIRTPKVRSCILNAINLIHDGVKALLNYKWKNLSLNEEIFLIQSEELEDEHNKDSEEIANYKVNIYSRACNHGDLYTDKTVAQIICESALDNVHLKRV